MNAFADADKPYTRIVPQRGWQAVNWRELYAYRDLFGFLVLRDLKVRYKQTILGFTWAIIRPVLSMVIFTIVFGGMASMPSDGVPYALFSFAALLPWTFYSTALTQSAQSLVSNAQMISKVYFPRLIIPATSVLGNLVDFAIASVVLGALMLYYGVAPTWNVFALPLLITIMMASALGAGLLLSALAIQYRDVNQALGFIVQAGMYAAPVVWPLSLLTTRFPEHGPALRLVYGTLYPIAGVIEGFRAALLGTTPMPWDLIALGTVSSVITLLLGAFYFRRMERRFADVA
jgi:lipopolysaccharide transport system permease protein